MAKQSKLDKAAADALETAEKAVKEARKAASKAGKEARKQAKKLEEKLDRIARELEESRAIRTTVTTKPVAERPAYPQSTEPVPPRVREPTMSVHRSASPVRPVRSDKPLAERTLVELRSIARERRLSGFSRLNKTDLLALLHEQDSPASDANQKEA